ncbi:DUF1772 domain-containing protein [Galbitalea sp. SE-J8]|uniref:DUF1772 domain-containing protein n=1 Tax=Galbitalea sp. SE-J8 TaxID=3054952 RepID=UPI00259CA5C0|nr:DUF1772 domain-containing protein [Galbitalea sp. SE-J8]MDM4761979.1 DUF1772 domain-containing protein [Galbitalea sp. SE-J8]
MVRIVPALAKLGIAHWLFGNLYEEVVKMPERLGADEPLLGPGSPVRYYLPVAPLTVGAAVVAARRAPRGGSRARLTAAAACTIAGAMLTGHLVRAVIVPLTSGRVSEPHERARLAAHWHRANRLRIVLAATALVASAAGR